MKKLVPILLAMVLVLTLCVVGFADAERYDDPEEATAPIAAQAAEDAAAQPEITVCAVCGKKQAIVQKVCEYEVGPCEEHCSHKTAGTDAVYYKYLVYQKACRNCGYKSRTWDVRGDETDRRCYGW